MLIYLTLDGKESEQEASKSIPYLCLSYADDVRVWLERCREIATNKPTVRETITQYVQLVKKITNQNEEDEMGNDLTKLLLDREEYFDALLRVLKTKSNLQQKSFEKLLECAQNISEEKGLNMHKTPDLMGKKPYRSVSFFTDYMIRRLGIAMRFEIYEGSKNTEFMYGFWCVDCDSAT